MGNDSRSHKADEASLPADNGLQLNRLPRQLTLVAQVEQLLRDAIASGRFHGDRLPTEVELAEQLGVSRETVRRATQNLAAEGLLVKYRRRGTFLSSPEQMELESIPTTLIAYLQADYSTGRQTKDDITRALSGLMLQGAVESATAQGYQLLVHRARPARMRQAYLELSQFARPQGLIFASVEDEKLLRQALGAGVPIVLLDHDLHLPSISTVRGDSAAAAASAVNSLAEQGHRRIALAYWNQVDLNPWGLQGYRQALRQLGLPRRRRWELLVEVNEKGTVEAIDEFSSLDPAPTALVCFNNTQARLIIAELARRGKRVPEDVSVIGCGGEEVPELTCYQADWYGLGRKACQVLLTAIEAGHEFEPEHHLMPYLLQEGRTVGPPP